LGADQQLPIHSLTLPAIINILLNQGLRESATPRAVVCYQIWDLPVSYQINLSFYISSFYARSFDVKEFIVINTSKKLAIV
jgi:hypothetical protein